MSEAIDLLTDIANRDPKRGIGYRPQRHRPVGNQLRDWHVWEDTTWILAHVTFRSDCAWSKCRRGQHAYTSDVEMSELHNLHMMGL